ncbi:hypothetical protein EOA60_23730 [Mesorhizobium sp. M1A.F.Ca.IN.020.06.1.1]|uniref:hypothetical protein n=1 Tax=unclassified Mesorhizobium TaxID=325217 RepID=UPI000FCC92EB|nr:MULTISPECIES: hypothetical protein [unclassified Mesorhizobium]RUV06458.1 hypothetical protein EOA79_08710 [Mesorhizobium sp. M1A.F.Ca.IN.020.03.2.1]RUV87504.1 hypothetical protein EOA51_10630 [Mesorhizobium sp. M1A.F.Ca.IN.020.32.1.1]RUW09568.1 hypothetical protein EOA46_17700 [Mesorhizobium sp. M1A.F.Ca.IN.022.05.2.1]RUW21878.1 hypothetical protein EOA60_23730 [Mesorhizobium sp. M1A.F.Ca.IN.020.06.1.1]RWF83045.1 MAG: hypothetical protein EOQ35_07655 [Mesorhizobium sp.]
MAKRSKSKKMEDECVIPPQLPLAELERFLFRHSGEEARRIADYLEWQAHGEEIVQHAEKVTSERVFGRDYDVWDVHTDKERWWVITNPTNLYSQRLMPSMDYTLSFHIGLMARVAAARRYHGTPAEVELFLVTQRKLVQVGEALDAADEVEEFQGIGMLCRECLLVFIRELIDAASVEFTGDTPKASHFIGWNDRLANELAGGASKEYARAYVKSTAERAWRLANWLTHSSGATRADAELAFSATSHVVEIYTSVALRRKAAAPARCERCQSSKIVVQWQPSRGRGGRYVAQCNSCGSEAVSRKPRARKPNSMPKTAVRS